MHIQVARENLLSALDRCDHVTNEKSVADFHKAVLLETQGDQQLRLYSTNSFLSVDTRAVMIGKAPGSIVVDTKYLLTTVRNMPAGYVELLVDPATLRVSVRSEISKRKYSLPGVSVDKYPRLPLPPDDTETLKLPIRDLVAWLKKVTFPLRMSGEAASHTDRAFLRGTQLIIAGTKITLCSIAPASAHGHCYVFGELKQPQTFNVFLPVVCHDSLSALAATDGELTIRKTESAVFLECAHTLIHSQLPQGQWPLENWLRPLPNVVEQVQCRIDADRFLDCAQAVGAAALGVAACLQVSLSAGTLSIRLVDSDHAGEDMLEVAGDGSFNVHFDPAVLLPALKAAGSETVGITYDEGWNVLVMRGENFLAFAAAMRAPQVAPPPREDEKPKGRGKRKVDE